MRIEELRNTKRVKFWNVERFGCNTPLSSACRRINRPIVAQSD